MSFQLCLAYPKSTTQHSGFRDLPELPPSLRTLIEPSDDSRGAEVRLLPPPASELIPNFASNDSTSVVYNAAPGFNLAPGANVKFSAEGLPKGVSIDADTGRITGVVDHSASSGIEGNAIYEVCITATDNNTGSESFRYFQWTVSNIEPQANPDFGATSEAGLVAGNVINGDGKGVDVAIKDGQVAVSPAASGTGRDIDGDGDPLEISVVAGHAANVGKAVACPGGGVLTMHANGDYVFRAPPSSNDQPAVERPLLLVPYSVRDSEGEADTTFLFLDQSNGASSTAAGEPATHVITSVAEIDAGLRQEARARIARAADDEPNDLRGLLDGPGDGDVSSLLNRAFVSHAGAGRAGATETGGGYRDAGLADFDLAMPAAPAEAYAGLPLTQADVASAWMADLHAGMVTASLS